MRFLILLRRKEIVWEQPSLDTMQYFVHGLGTESIEYLDMTPGGVFVHCMVEEGKLILDRILSVTPLEDMQIKASLISQDEPIITYLDALDIPAIPAREEFLLVIIRCRKTCTSLKNCYLLSVWSTRRLICAKITA
jgi:hypothetical protein